MQNYTKRQAAGVKRFNVFDDLMTYLTAGGSGTIAALYNGSSLIGYWGHDGTYRRPYGPIDLSSLATGQTVFTTGTGKNIDPLAGAIAYSSGAGLAAAGSLAFDLWDTIADWRYRLNCSFALTQAAPADGDAWYVGIIDSSDVVGCGGQERVAGTITAYGWYDNPPTRATNGWNGSGAPNGALISQYWRVAGTRRIDGILRATADWWGYGNQATADCPADTDRMLLTLAPTSAMSIYLTGFELSTQ